MANDVWNGLTSGSSYWDPEHMSFGDNGEGKYRRHVEQNDKYTQSRNAFAAQKHFNTGYGSPDHPQLHGGHRTVEDFQNDLDTGHKILGGGGHPALRTNKQGHNIFDLHADEVHRHHSAALEAGYAANSHIYMGRQADAKRASEREAYFANRPSKVHDIWGENVEKAKASTDNSFAQRSAKSSNPWETKPDTSKELFPDSKPSPSPAATPQKRGGLIGRLRKK
jgi:hypothetical protein